MIETGWVYVITNESMPGLAKVGVTSNRPEKRARELDETGSPTPYKVETAFLFSEEAERIEKKAHALLADVRVRGNREWFRCSPQQAAEKVMDAADSLKSPVLKNEPILLSEQELYLRKKKKEEEKAAEALRRKNQQAAEKRKQEQKILAEQEQAAKRARQNDIRIRFYKIWDPLAKQARGGNFKAQILIEYFSLTRLRVSRRHYNEYTREMPYSEMLYFLNNLKRDPKEIYRIFQSVKIDPKEPGIIGVSLGQCYALGFGVKENPVEAYSWFRRVLDSSDYPGLGKLRAASALFQCYHLGFGVAKSPLKVIMMKALIKSIKPEVKRREGWSS